MTWWWCAAPTIGTQSSVCVAALCCPSYSVIWTAAGGERKAGSRTIPFAGLTLSADLLRNCNHPEDMT
jgi:molybdenum cofactor guanylyltransferase